VWEILEMAMEESRNKFASIPDTCKMMDVFRVEVSRRRIDAKNPEEYEKLMLQIIEMWSAFMGDECENQSLKNLWVDGGLEGGKLAYSGTLSTRTN
jgi:hypothetical protein